MRINITTGKLIAIGAGVLVLTAVGALLAVPTVRHGIVATFKGSVKDTATLVKGNSPPPSNPKGPTLEELQKLQQANNPQPSSQPNQPTPTETTSPEERLPDNLKVTYLNTAGSSILIQEGKYALLIDGSDGSDADVVVNKMKAAGVGSLRYVVASNYHSSSLEGLPKILSYYPADYIFMSQNVETDKKGAVLRNYLTGKNLLWTVPSRTSKYQLEKAYFELIPTHDGGSLVTALYNGVSRFVFTGSTTRVDDPSIKDLPQQVDVYSVNTTDSDYVLPKAVFDQVKPKNVIINGKADSATTSASLDQLKAPETTVYQAGVAGDITVSSNGTDIIFKLENQTEKK